MNRIIEQYTLDPTEHDIDELVYATRLTFAAEHISFTIKGQSNRGPNASLEEALTNLQQLKEQIDSMEKNVQGMLQGQNFQIFKL